MVYLFYLGFFKLFFSKYCNIRQFEIRKVLTAFVYVNTNHFQRNIVKGIKRTKYCTIMADEAANVSHNEQLVICIRWVDEDLEVHEDFVGMHHWENTKAETIFMILKVKIVLWIFQCTLPLILMPHDHVHMFKLILMFQLMSSF